MQLATIDQLKSAIERGLQQVSNDDNVALAYVLLFRLKSVKDGIVGSKDVTEVRGTGAAAPNLLGRAWVRWMRSRSAGPKWSRRARTGNSDEEAGSSPDSQPVPQTLVSPFRLISREGQCRHVCKCQ